jgi:CHAT domain-containing protein
LIWKPLLDSIKGKKNIYFSASGLLNAVGIEYFTPEDIRMCNIYRLSSTKELCKPNKRVQWYHCALFGGLNYDRALSSNVIDNTVSERGTFDNLPFSYEEILSIRQELSNCHIDCELYSKDNGTEDIFNKLSNRNVDILHIASHGLFIPSDQASQKSKELNMPFLTREFNKEESNEDNALNRAFVLLSGGNRRITREVCPEDGEDGVLTALEISRLNFKNIDLVVLSACNTAKGDINSEGVFGLQRGFKKAGVNTILMSLDRIDDEATKILMVEFYKNLMSGKTKLQSLKDAQQHLRTTENGKYSDPKYWASFIMLDGLN